jgi:hypothetical protein
MSIVFNPNSSTGEVNNRVNVIDSNGNSLVDTYLSKNGGILNGSLILEGINSKIIFDNGTSQSIAFDAGKSNQFDSLISLTENITNKYGLLNINQKVNFRQNVEFLQGIEMPDNTISMSKINGLSNSLTALNTTVANNTTNTVYCRT